MIDLDHFKVVNDQYGHPFGDYVLRHLAEVVAGSIRESDLVGRYGGEEFAVALPEAGEEQAIRAAEKLREAIEATEFRHEGVPPPSEPPVKITISIGVASLSSSVDQDQDEFELIRRADQALYEAKRTGRNRVVLYTKDLLSPGGVPAVSHHTDDTTEATSPDSPASSEMPASEAVDG
jgi:diguanylate cyclase (GGDEF)-like protein